MAVDTLAKQNASIIKFHKSRSKPQRRQWKRHAAAFRSEFFSKSKSDDDGGYTDSDEATARENNRLFAFVDTVVANICPNNPRVTIKARNEDQAAAAQFRTGLVDETFNRQKFHQKLWAATTRACVFPRCFVKVVWDGEKKFPRLRVLNPHFVFFDSEAEDYDDIRYICEVTTMNKQEFQKRVKTPGRGKPGYYNAETAKKVKFGTYPGWIREAEKGLNDADEDDSDIARAAFEWTTVYEFYDLANGKYFHFADECEEPLFVSDLPYKHCPNPFILMTFNDNLNDLGGLSDARLVFSNIERMNELDSLEMKHVKSTIPSMFFNKSAVTNPESFLNGYLDGTEPGSVQGVDVAPGVPLGDIMQPSPMTQLPVNWGNARDGAAQEIHHTLGMPDYQRGDVGGSDVATAYALADTATRTRNERRKKVVYDVMGGTAKRILALFAEFMQDEDEIYTRMATGDTVKVGVDLLDFEEGYDVNAWDFEAHPFNAQEGNDVVQLKSLEAFAPMLVGNPAVDQTKLFHKLLDLLGLPDLKGTGQPAVPQGEATPPGAPGEMPPDLMQQAAAGQVMGGTGEQSIESPLEGGTPVAPGRPTMAG